MCDSRYNVRNQGILFHRFCNNKIVKQLNSIIYSDVFYLLVAVLCVIAFTYSQELIVYTLYIAIIAFIVLFGEKIARFLIVLPFFYIAPSVIHNPAVFDDSIFKNIDCLIYMGVLAIVGITFVVMGTVRCAVQEKSKPFLQCSYLALGFAYLCSGLLTDGASGKNLIFSLIEIISISAVYFIGFYLVDSKTNDISTFAKIGCAMGLTLLVEIFDIYLFSGVFERGYLNRGNIFTGWGIHNNLGNMLCFCIPCAFYMMYRSGKRKSAWFIYACLLMIAVVLTTSRGSMLTGGILFLLCLAFVLFKFKRQKIVKMISFTIFGTIVIGICAFILLWMRYDFIKLTVEKILDIGILNDSNRFKAWKEGLNQFFHYPIFGKGFYECSAYLFHDGVADLLPARWHNTIVQLLASCGIVGVIAYAFHRIQTIRLFWKNRSIENYFIALSILAILIGSLTDNHFFNIGPGIIYGMFLAFAEKNLSEIVDAPVSI